MFPFLDRIKEFIHKYPDDNEAALQLGELMVHRLAWKRIKCLYLIQGDHHVHVYDREFKRVYDAFMDYGLEHGLVE